jgi:hypothetical protein
MKSDGQLTIRLLAIAFCFFIHAPCHAWHQTLTFQQRLSYENGEIPPCYFFAFRTNTSLDLDVENVALLSEMRFFTWYEEYAIYGAREKLILLKPNLTTSSVNEGFVFL